MGDELDDAFGEKVKRDYFSMIPHIVDDLALTPYAFRLYVHLCRVVGNDGKCWQSTDTLAAACHISTGAIVKAKRELVRTKIDGKPLIVIVPIPGLKPGSAYHTIYVNNLWEANHEKYAKKEKEPNSKVIPGILTKGYKVHVVNDKVHVVT